MTFNPEDYGIERVGRKRAGSYNKKGIPYIKKSISRDGKEYIYVRLNAKLTQEFKKVFGQYVGIGLINGNLMFYPEDDIDYAITISAKDSHHDNNAQIYIPKSLHDHLKKTYGNNFKSVPCNWVRHILGGHTCFEFVGTDVKYDIVQEQVVA